MSAVLICQTWVSASCALFAPDGTVVLSVVRASALTSGRTPVERRDPMSARWGRRRSAKSCARVIVSPSLCPGMCSRRVYCCARSAPDGTSSVDTRVACRYGAGPSGVIACSKACSVYVGESTISFKDFRWAIAVGKSLCPTASATSRASHCARLCTGSAAWAFVYSLSEALRRSRKAA